jgi:hypothetical protein
MMTRLLIFCFVINTATTYAQVCFDPKTSYPVAINTSAICSGDFNADGNIDVAAANKTGTVSILLNNGTGILGTAAGFEVGFLADAICSADFNGDGITDLATSNLGPWNVSVLLGDGTGNFITTTSFTANTPHSIASADFNADGNPDLAVGTQFTMLVALGNGDGTFGNPVSYGTGHSYSSIVATDLNGDGSSDLVMTGGENKVWRMLADGTGSFSAPVSFIIATIPVALVNGDFNGDGNTDLATANYQSNDISVLIGDGTGNFVVTGNFSAGNYPTALTSGDFDEDLITDLAVADAAPAEVTVLSGDGLGNFAMSGTFAVNSFPSAIISEDFNADGKADLGLSNAFTNIDTGMVDILLSCTATGTISTEPGPASFILYPNPAQGKIHINASSIQEPVTAIEIHNTYGEKVFEELYPLKTVYEIDIDMKAAGVYLIHLSAGGKIYIGKVVLHQ